MWRYFFLALAAWFLTWTAIYVHRHDTQAAIFTLLCLLGSLAAAAWYGREASDR